MAGAPIKFRCFQCNQLLGVSRSRVGSVVACPKCATDLIVPDPDEAPPAMTSAPAPGAPTIPSPPLSAEATPAFLQALDAGLPVELADLRPEDIRADSSIPWSPAVTTAPPPPPLPPEPIAPAPEPPPPVAPPVPPPDLRPPPSPSGAAAAPPSPPATTPAPEPVLAPVVPPIKIESPPLIEARMPAARSRDLVLPRSVVATWSLFVLIAQALAFLAGLLAGHYIWRVH